MPKRKIREDDNYYTVLFDNPLLAAPKLLTNILDEKKQIFDYIELPVDQIVEYQNKQDSDFHAYSESKFEQLIASIKECGVLEAITVRPLETARYELLAGEQRWKAAIAAGLRTIPAHVLKDISDDAANDYFTLTNLIRRDLTISDRINGWWLWCQSNKRQGFRSDLIDTIEQKTEDSMSISPAQIKRLAKMHDLIPEILAMLDDPKIKMSANAGYHLSFLTPDEQKEIANLNVRIQETVAQKLKNLSQNHGWSKEKALEIVNGIAPKTKRHDFKPLVKSVKKIAKTRLKPEYYEQADQIFSEAMELYFKLHPEVKAEADHTNLISVCQE